MEPKPSYWGPGVWFTVHSAAARVRSQQAFWNFVETFLPILANLPCSVCTGHSRDFMEKHHPTKYATKTLPNGRYIGAFLWVHDLHNAASAHAGNEPIDFEESCEIFESILKLSDEAVASDRVSARSSSTVHKIHHTPFVSEPADAAVVTPPVVPAPVIRKVMEPTVAPTPIVRQISPVAAPIARPVAVPPAAAAAAPPKPAGCSACAAKRAAALAKK